MVQDRNTSPDFGEYLTVEETANLTRIPANTLNYWRSRNRGEGPKWFKLGRRVYYRRVDIDEFLVASYKDSLKNKW